MAMHQSIAELEARLRELMTGLWYCYDKQAWIRDRIVLACGHRVQTPGCYACTHAGERHDPCTSCH